jgi:hypothetical protein
VGGVGSDGGQGWRRPGPEHQTDVVAHQNLSCNCDNFHFFNLVGHF